jgi:hypothetical protein
MLLTIKKLIKEMEWVFNFINKLSRDCDNAEGFEWITDNHSCETLRNALVKSLGSVCNKQRISRNFSKQIKYLAFNSIHNKINS